MMLALDEHGLTQNTIFVFTSDHGEMFRAHGRRAKYIFYEEAARVPFLIEMAGPQSRYIDIRCPARDAGHHAHRTLDA